MEEGQAQGVNVHFEGVEVLVMEGVLLDALQELRCGVQYRCVLQLAHYLLWCLLLVIVKFS